MLTWRASRRAASSLALTDEQKDAFRDFADASGGWTREEIDTWTDAELTALCVQWDWATYQADSERGRVPSTLYIHDGKLFWSCAQ